jgi:magnesium-transporting ATPase (P-type)
MAFLVLVACQIGTAFAARTERASLRSIGVFSNRFLLLGIAIEVLFAAAVAFVEPLQHLFGTATVPTSLLLVLLPVPLIIWGSDELARFYARRRRAAAPFDRDDGWASGRR